MPIHFTAFLSPTDPKGAGAVLPWTDVRARLAEPAIGPKGAGHGWAPVAFRDNYRDLTHALEAHALVLDDDSGETSLERAKEIWSAYAGAIHTTASHRDDSPVHRTVILLSRPVRRDEHARLMEWAFVRAAERGQTLDPKCKDISRYWHLPTIDHDGAPFAFVDLDGTPLDVDAVLRSAPIVTMPELPTETDDVPADDPTYAERCTIAEDLCRREPLHLRGSGDNEERTFILLQKMRRGLRLPAETTREIFRREYDARLPEGHRWTDDGELTHKIRDARTAGHLIAPDATWNAARAMTAIESLAAPAVLRDLDRAPLAVRRKKNPDHVYTHVPGVNAPSVERKKIPLSEVVGVLRLHSAWKGVWQRDVFRGRVLAVDPPMHLDAETTGLSERDITAVRTWLECQGVTAAHEETARAIDSATVDYHPVREYLDALPPSQGRAIERLARIIGDEPKWDFLLRRFLIAAVARIYNPGAKVDSMLVLYGPQGFGKSDYFTRELFGEWTKCQNADLASKDASLSLRGAWVMEFAELDSVLRAEASTVKAFLSRMDEDFRAPYGKEENHEPRQCVFIGTTNDEDFLRDATGNRRFWPMHMCRQLAQGEVSSIRDAVWAEALALFRAGEQWHLTSDEKRDLAERHGEHELLDPWHEKIRDYCCSKEWVRAEEVYTKAIALGDSGALAKMTRRELDRVTATLRRLKCARRVLRQGGRTERVWLVSDALRTAAPSAEAMQRARLDNVLQQIASA